MCRTPFIHIDGCVKDMRHGIFRSALLRPLLVVLMLCASLAGFARWGDKPLNRPYADLKRLHFGFSVGAHVQDLQFTHNGLLTPGGTKWQLEVPSFSPGFCVNVLADLRLHKYINLRLSPGMYFGNKTVRMVDFNGVAENRSQDVKSSFVVLPIDIKLSGERLQNTRPYLTFGALGTYDVSKKRSEELMFNSMDFYLTVGLGCDFYLPFFKLNPEIKFCFGLTDILKHKRPDLVDDDATFEITQSISKVKSNMVVINFYFE